VTTGGWFTPLTDAVALEEPPVPLALHVAVWRPNERIVQTAVEPAPCVPGQPVQLVIDPNATEQVKVEEHDGYGWHSVGLAKTLTIGGGRTMLLEAA
jgi:hypothetical protein